MNKRMINSSRKLSALILLLVLLFSGGIPRAQVGETVIFETDEIQKLLKENKIPTLGIGVIRGGKLTEVKVFGELSKGMTAPFDTIFNVASLTKPVTAMVALRLASAGKFNLDEPLDKYWIDPDVKDDPRHKKLTARLVLSHRTGFANWRWLNKSKKLEFAFEPGTKYQYSGEGFEYLRKALEKKFNEPLETLADELIFRPLGMRDTRFTWDAKMDATRFAPGYDKQGNAYALSHGGSDEGANALVFLLPKSRQGLIIFTNSDNGTSVYLKLIALYLKDNGKRIIDIEMKTG